ncbi:hypothetical protein AB0F77_40720 [Streptomyces sp. NPDC026672]|uniref:hypothetical protein n=1 Tax=unclassified Streptomyces TaxID=2593676 RepID=UPI0033C03FD6
MTDIPDELIKLERSAEEERARLAGLEGEEYEEQRRRWRAAAETFQAAVTAYASREDVGLSRHEVEQAVKRAVRHADEDPAG